MFGYSDVIITIVKLCVRLFIRFIFILLLASTDRGAGLCAARDAGVGIHRAGDLGDARCRRVGATVGHRERGRTQRGNDASGRPGQLR